LEALDPGFDADGVARVSVRVPSCQSRASRIAAIHAAVRQALKEAGPPLSAEAGASQYFGRVTLDQRQATVRPVASLSVSSDYLRLLNVRVREGRLLRDDGDPAEVVVNESFAKQAWPGRSAIGSVFVSGSPEAVAGSVRVGVGVADTPRVVVGVVGDMWPEYTDTANVSRSVRPAVGTDAPIRSVESRM
jgi:hypothetical protein